MVVATAREESDSQTLPSRRPKSRQVTSRYLSSSSSSTTTTSSSSSTNSSNSSRRSATSSTPFVTPAVKRAQSVERTRRPITPRPRLGLFQLTDSKPSNDNNNSVTSAKILTSTRSLAVSFQGESFSLPISKTKTLPPPQIVRKCTPERRRTNTPIRVTGGDQVENSKPVDLRWPGCRSRVANSTNPLSRSLDRRALDRSLIDEAKSSLVKSIQFPIDVDSVDGSVSVSSDTDSVSSCGNYGNQERMRNVLARGMNVPPPKMNLSKRFGVESSVGLGLSPRPVSSSRGMSPMRGPVRPASPSKMMMSSSRGMPSPSRTRNGPVAAAVGPPMVGQLSSMSSVLSLRGKKGENQIEDAHLLRLFYNRQLQLRFVNARADAALLVQRLTVEKNLYDAWTSLSELRDSVTFKRIKLQFLRQNSKITSILKGQIPCLEESGRLEKEHSNSLSGAIEALEASTLRLPLVGGARADVQNMKEAVSSAVDVMQTMASSVCSALSKVEELNSLAAQLAKMTRQERALLDQCKDLLSMLAAMQVKDSSLRSHILQVKRVPTSLTTQV